MSREILLEKMTWPEVEERLKETQIAIIPTGSCEEHGHHLPVSTDFHCAEAFATLVAKEVADDVGAVVVPVMPFGRTALMDWPGTISIQPQTLINVYMDILESLIHHGFNKLVIMNWHFGNTAPWDIAMRTVKLKTNAWIGRVGSGSFLPKGFRNGIIETQEFDGHGGEGETSSALALGLNVRMDKRSRRPPKYEGPEGYVAHPPAPVASALWGCYLPLSESMDTGIMGDPTKASKEKGEKIIKKCVEGWVEFLRKLNEVEVKSKPFDIWDSRS